MYSLDEVGLIPATISDIKHRGDVNPYVLSPFGGEKLPIFVAPMTCILSANNVCTFSQSRVEPILPVCSGGLELRRQLPNGSDWKGWTAVTLQEFTKEFIEDYPIAVPYWKSPYYVLIDVANGHMSELFSIVKRAKQDYGNDIIIMLGNIANPNTYIKCCEAGVDYVRIGIGGGSGCTTSVQTGIHTSIPYILEEIKGKKLAYRSGINSFKTKIIADGGINTISKAIKALALGADYVMMGKCFAECEECNLHVREYHDKSGSIKVENHYYGQSSEQGQLDRFGKVKSNPEGSDLWVPVTTDLTTFSNKFEAALRSAMSYCGAKNLNEFIGKVKYEYMTPTEFNSFNK